MQPKTYLILTASLVLTASAQISNVGRPMTTATQAVISYQAPDTNPCVVEVREAGETALVHDVNPALFTNSNSDLGRTSSIAIGNRRVLVVGKRAAELAADGYRYSRALQTDTDHGFRITCGAFAPYNGVFRTTNVPLGNGYMEAIPADSTKPGQPAWPTLKWGDRAQKIIDPQTGVQLRRITTEIDVTAIYPGNFVGTLAPAWTSASSVLADDAATASYAGSTREPLFLEYGVQDFPGGGTHKYQSGRINEFQLNLNAWCQGGDCSIASPADRTLDICLTVDGVSCVSDVLTLELAVCNASCTGATPHRYAVGDTLVGHLGQLKGWFANSVPGFDHTSIYRHLGGVNRDGEKVYWLYGNTFDVLWQTGSRISINNVSYTIASIESDKELTLQGTPAGVENGVGFVASNFGVLIRKQTVSTTPLSIQSASLRVLVGDGPANWDAAGGVEGNTNCSHQTVAGPGGEQGWHCHISNILYWIGKDSGTVSRLGRAKIPYRDGTDGWPPFFCDQSYWDKNNGNDLYCAFAETGGEVIVMRSRYFGSNTSENGTEGINQGLKECGFYPEPCWTFTNLTLKSQGRSLRELATAFHPDFASFPNKGFRLVSALGGSSRLQFIASRDSSNNDSLGFFVYFNVATGQIDAAAPSWKYWPARWSVNHGPQELGDNSWTFLPLTYFRGPLTGNDYLAGNGPYYTQVASGPVTLNGEACPARPPGSPIPVEQWPTGNVCLTISVDGEPADPTPKFSNAGTVSVTGNVVTLTGGEFDTATSGFKMKIGDDYYVFTRTAATTGTLSPQPTVSIFNSAYRLYFEEVDNPKTGSLKRDFAYLQDAEVRDTFCLTDFPNYGGPAGCGHFFQTEYLRLVIKTGNTWVLERGYSKKGIREQFFAVGANAYLMTIPPACDFTLYSCAKSGAQWNVDLDPFGRNQNGTTVEEGGSTGAGHGILRPIGEVAAVALFGCPPLDGVNYACYNSRIGANMLETITSPTNIVFSGQPTFHGKLGIGVPNAVDSHPSLAGLLHPMFQQPGIAKRWFMDGRPFLGATDVTGGPASPAAPVAGSLYRFTSSQVPRFRRKTLPTMASCGSHPLLDVSGPNSLIDGQATDAFKYCVADRAGECRSNSQSGDVFFNCPRISEKYCRNNSIGEQLSDTYDVCISDNAAYTNTAIQAGFDRANMFGIYGRPITKQLSRSRYVDLFWNVKSSPDGKWMFFRTMWANNFGNEVLMAKLPPFPAPDSINRGDYIPVSLDIAASVDAAETHAVVEFGYNADLYCGSRSEVCVKGAVTNPEYAYEYENVAGVSCQTGCRIVVPALPQHVLYYRVVRKTAGNTRGSVGHTEVTVTP